MGSGSTKPQGGSHDLGRATWADVSGAPAGALLVPVGSCEQHGPHLPLDTDTRIAVAIAERVAAERSDPTWVGPPVAYGASGEHQDFPGTLSIGHPALARLLIEIGRSAFAEAASPYSVLVFVNGHGGNQGAVRIAVETLQGEGRPVAGWSPSTDGDAHAGRTETSLLLAIAPGAVGPDRPTGRVEPLADLIDDLRLHGVRAVSKTGVLGDATSASAEEGHEILRNLVADLRRTVDEAG